MRFLICLFFPCLVFSLNIDQLIHKDVSNPKLIFESKAKYPLQIQMARVYFLGASSCYEKYMSKQELEAFKTPLVLNQNERISLDPKGLYQAALSSVGQDEIEKIASALIRLRSIDSRWLAFIGGCEDQQDNCCVPIHCHPSVAECVPEIENELQFIK